MLLILIFGAITGLALGLTGCGGTMLALPFLMYGLGLPAHDAVAVSLVAVGAMASVSPYNSVFVASKAPMSHAGPWGRAVPR